MAYDSYQRGSVRGQESVVGEEGGVGKVHKKTLCDWHQRVWNYLGLETTK